MKTSCEFRFGFMDVTARGDAHFSVSQNQDYARIEDINTEDGITFPDAATLEPDFGWPLDGRKEWLPDNAKAVTWGWWSTDLSGDDGAFQNPPTLEVTFFDDEDFPTPHSSAGITLTFVATLPGSLNIKWYGHLGQLLAEQDFSPDSFVYFCERQVENYYKVVITINSMRFAHRFLRVSGILFGVLEILDDARLNKATLTEEVSPVSITVPITKVELSFFTPDGRFALLDPTGAYRLFQWRQELAGTKTIDGQKTVLGTYYLQTASGTVDANTSLTCVDIIGILDALEYKGGIYVEKPVADLLEDILGPEGIVFDLDTAFAETTVSGHLAIGSKRAALQQIAFAIGAVVTTAGGESIHIAPAPKLVTREISPPRKVIGHKTTLEDLVTQVAVTAHKYELSDELKELTKTTLEPGEHTLTFTSPVKVETVSGATMKVNHPNYCVVSVAEAGEVVLSGYAYQDSQTVYTVKTDPLPAGVKDSVKSFSSATLVDPGKALAVAQRLHAYYQSRYTSEGQVLPGLERAGELAEVSSLGGRTLTGYIQRVVTDLYGGGLETVTVRGN